MRLRAQRQKARMLEQSGTTQGGIVVAKARYQRQLQEHKRFCSDMGLTPQMERVYIDGLGRVAQGEMLNPIVNGDRNVTINRKDYTVLRDVGTAAPKHNARLPEGTTKRLKKR